MYSEVAYGLWGRWRSVTFMFGGNNNANSDRLGISTPQDIRPNMKSGSVTDNNCLVRTIDGDIFCSGFPRTIPSAIVSIPGYDHSGHRRTLDFDEQLLSTHVAMVGGIGTGKTNLINHFIGQIGQKLTSDDIMIIFDSKGDFHRTFWKEGDIVISNDERGCGPSGRDNWNIFDEIDPFDSNVSIREICASLFKESIKHTTNSFFPNAASDLLSAIISIFYENWKKSSGADPTNKDLVDFLHHSDIKALLTVLTASKKFASVASYISDPGSGQSQGVVAEMNSVVNRLFIGNFAGSGHISMNRILEERGGKTVFIEYDLCSGETLSPIYSLLVDLALKKALSNRNPHKGSVYLFVDEFKLLPNLSHIEDAVNFGRSLGVKVFIALQSITQIYDGYGELKGKSILSGFLNCMFFNVNNAESREFIKARFGQCLRKITYAQNKDHVFTEYVVRDKDITRLDVGTMIVARPLQAPFLFNSDIWGAEPPPSKFIGSGVNATQTPKWKTL